MEILILNYFQQVMPCKEMDSLDYVSTEVLSHKNNIRIMHPVAYFSKKIVSAKSNYKIYNKELLAIIRCFEEWRPELESTAMPMKVLTNHKSLESFMKIKKVTPRQTKWTEFLSKFNFVITYQTGKKNDKTNALTRKPNKKPANDKDKRQEYRMQVLLLLKQIALQSIEQAELHTEPYPEESVETKDLDWELIYLPTLSEWVKESNQKDVLFTEICEYLNSLLDYKHYTVYF